MNEALLHDQVVLIIGAGRAPAPALARAFADQGAILAANDFSPITLDQAAAQVLERGGRIKTYVADATRGMPLRAMIDEVLEDWGRVDVLVNNPRVQPSAPLLGMDEWDWQRTIEINLNGPFLVTQLVARLMREQGGGTILNIVDTNPTSLDLEGNAAYAASQQGFYTLTQAAARELMAYNIRVYALCPDDPGGLSGDVTAGVPVAAGWEDHLNRLAVTLCSRGEKVPPGQVFRVSQTGVIPHLNILSDNTGHQE
jgi:NAD(P)-dependent dehydrogenase (short-subunit alcohol dehydrogenase family)